MKERISCIIDRIQNVHLRLDKFENYCFFLIFSMVFVIEAKTVRFWDNFFRIANSRILKGPTINRKWPIWRLLWKIHFERCAVWYWTLWCHSLSFVGNSKGIFQSKSVRPMSITHSHPFSEISRRTARRMEKMLQGSHLWYEW